MIDLTKFMSRHFHQNRELGSLDLHLKQEILTSLECFELTQYLQNITDWKGGDYLGRSIKRYQRWYHMEQSYFCKDWPEFDRWHSYKYDDKLLALQQQIYDVSKKMLDTEIEMFDSILINYYPTGKEIIPRHRDSEAIFGDNPVIAVLSLGTTRTMKFTEIEPDVRSLKKVPDGKEFEHQLNPNSLLIMSGTMQKYYSHEILPETEETGPRYSLTFRKHKDQK